MMKEDVSGRLEEWEEVGHRVRRTFGRVEIEQELEERDEIFSDDGEAFDQLGIALVQLQRSVTNQKVAIR